MRSMLLLALLLVAACGSNSATGPEATLSMTGDWGIGLTITGTMVMEGDTMPPSPANCQGGGVWTLVDTLGALGGNYRARLRCANAAGVLDSVGNFGQLVGTRTDLGVAMQAGYCTLVGTLAPTRKHASGTVRCTVGFRDLEMSGTWEGDLYETPTCGWDCWWARAADSLPAR